MTTIILDCYTDEPSGLGVPPYLGTYPRYIAGALAAENEEYIYLTIDDLRLLKKYKGKLQQPKPSEKTNISIYNFSKNNVQEVLEKADKIIAIVGIHTPGKYLSAQPATLKEVEQLLDDFDGEKILTGPAVFGTQTQGGKKSEKETRFFDKKDFLNFSFEQLKTYAPAGAAVIKQIQDKRIVEIETGRGCTHGKCSFCTEPLKNKIEYRDNNDIVDEIAALYKQGVRHFRLGKQACFYSIPKPIELLKDIRKTCPDISVLHIDNVNPRVVLNPRGEEITKAIVQYCTPGNVAAFGVETFDKKVSELNTLNTYNEEAFQAVKIINKYGATRGENGMHNFLPGINILFGLIGETKETHEQNMFWLKKILQEDLLLRRINIRQAIILPGTRLAKEAGTKFLKKNKKYYWKWRNQIRQEIDWPMLKKLVPKGSILKDVYPEIYDGKTTFGRQVGTYPLVIGMPGRLPLKQPINVKVTGHMLRSITAEPL